MRAPREGLHDVLFVDARACPRDIVHLVEREPVTGELNVFALEYHACHRLVAVRANSVGATRRSTGPEPSAVASSPKPRTCTLRPVAGSCADTSTPASTGKLSSRDLARIKESWERQS